MAAFITDHKLLTVRQNDSFDIDEVVRRWGSAPELTKRGVSFLPHGLPDYVVNSRFDTVQALDEQIEELVFAGQVNHADRQRRSLHLSKAWPPATGWYCPCARSRTP